MRRSIGYIEVHNITVLKAARDIVKPDRPIAGVSEQGGGMPPPMLEKGGGGQSIICPPPKFRGPIPTRLSIFHS